MKILLVEDEQKLAEALAKGLAHEGYTADIINDGKKALTRISLHRNDYDLIILDLMLPSMDGLEICRQVREMGITIPIIILTARAETDTKVKLLLAGADDYLVKPFSFAELNARIQALLPRPNQVVNREDLLNHLWDFNYVGFSNVVDVHVKNLRRKLSSDGGDVLETVRGVGYRLAE